MNVSEGRIPAFLHTVVVGLIAFFISQSLCFAQNNSDWQKALCKLARPHWAYNKVLGPTIDTEGNQTFFKNVKVEWRSHVVCSKSGMCPDGYRAPFIVLKSDCVVCPLSEKNRLKRLKCMERAPLKRKQRNYDFFSTIDFAGAASFQDLSDRTSEGLRCSGMIGLDISGQFVRAIHSRQGFYGLQYSVRQMLDFDQRYPLEHQEMVVPEFYFFVSKALTSAGDRAGYNWAGTFRVGLLSQELNYQETIQESSHYHVFGGIYPYRGGFLRSWQKSYFVGGLVDVGLESKTRPGLGFDINVDLPIRKGVDHVFGFVINARADFLGPFWSFTHNTNEGFLESHYIQDPQESWESEAELVLSPRLNFGIQFLNGFGELLVGYAGEHSLIPVEISVNGYDSQILRGLFGASVVLDMYPLWISFNYLAARNRVKAHILSNETLDSATVFNVDFGFRIMEIVAALRPRYSRWRNALVLHAEYFNGESLALDTDFQHWRDEVAWTFGASAEIPIVGGSANDDFVVALIADIQGVIVAERKNLMFMIGLRFMPTE